MSVFTGAILLAGDGDAPAVLPPPDEPGLGPATWHRSARSAVAHRLRVVTAEDRREIQPRPAWGGKGWVAFAGRLDDRATLISALGLDETDPTDGELAACAIERWDAEAPARLLGDYALAAWHEPRRELILTGDAMAMRTVYYWRRGARVLFSTSLRALMAMPEVPRAPNEVFIADYLAMNFGDDETTFYRDVLRVLPDTAVVLSPDGSRTVTFHRFDPERRVTLENDSAYVEAARELLDRAVADRQRAVGPVPISASAGLDSTSVAMSVLAGSGTATLLTAVPDPNVPHMVPRLRYGDEQPLVERLVSAFPGIRAEFLAAPTHSDWSPGGRRIFDAIGAPHRVPGDVAWFDPVQQRAAEMGASTILSGMLGNLTLSWDGMRRFPDLLKSGRWLTLALELALGSGGNPRRLANLVGYHLLRPLWPLPDDPRALADRSGLRLSTIADLHLIDRLRVRGNDSRHLAQATGRAWRALVIRRNRSRRSESMALARSLYGIEHAGPLADLRLVEFCLAIPEEQFLRNGTRRYLAKRLLRAAGVPPAITENPRRGLQHPEWFAHLTLVRPTLPALIERLRRSPTANRLLDVDRLDHLVCQWPADAAQAERHSAVYQVMLQVALSIGSFAANLEIAEN